MHPADFDVMSPMTRQRVKVVMVVDRGGSVVVG